MTIMMAELRDGETMVHNRARTEPIVHKYKNGKVIIHEHNNPYYEDGPPKIEWEVEKVTGEGESHGT